MLGNNLLDVEAYSEAYNIWMCVDLTYTYVLTLDSHIFIHQHGVVCLDEQEQLSCFLSTPTSQHLRYNMPAEWAAIRVALKKTKTTKRRQSKSVDTQSDSDIEFVDNSKQITLKFVMKEEPDNDFHSQHLQWPRLMVTMATWGSAVQPITIPDSPLSETSTVLMLSPLTQGLTWSNSIAASSPTPSSSSEYSSLTLLWPHGMYAVDVVDGLMKKWMIACSCHSFLSNLIASNMCSVVSLKLWHLVIKRDSGRGQQKSNIRLYLMEGIPHLGFGW